jgi:integrase
MNGTTQLGSVIVREGARGRAFAIKYRDAAGKQVFETVGRERDGWSEKRARMELGKRLDAVAKGLRKPQRRTFGMLLDEFDRVALAAKPRKRSTLIAYRNDMRLHLRPAFASDDLERLSHAPERFEEYAAEKLEAGRSPKSVRNDLGLLKMIFKAGRRWGWVNANPLELVELPPLAEAETETLDPSQIAELLAAYQLKADAAEPDERFWWDAARRMTIVALSTGLRRGELLGLRWMDIELLDRRLHVRQAFVLGEMTTPKSKAGRRTIPLGSVAIEALEEQFSSTCYQDSDCVVFCHPALGTPLDPSKLSGYARKAQTAAGVDPSFRVWHGLRHTALTETAASGLPAMYVRPRLGTPRARRRSVTFTRTGLLFRMRPHSPRRDYSAASSGSRAWAGGVLRLLPVFLSTYVTVCSR